MDVLTLDQVGFLYVGSLRWAGLFAPYWGGQSLLNAFCLLVPWQIYETLYLFFRMQKYRPITAQDAGMILFSMGDGIFTHLS
jgi:hypothetical protein